MATKQAYAIRGVNARERVFSALRSLFPDAEMPQIPQFSKYGQDHLQAQQWEVLADWFDGHVASGDADEELNSYDTLSRAELEALVADRGLTDKVLPTGSNNKPVKSDFLQVLLDADAEKPSEPEESSFSSQTFEDDLPVTFDEGSDDDALGGATSED